MKINSERGTRNLPIPAPASKPAAIHFWRGLALIPSAAILCALALIACNGFVERSIAVGDFTVTFDAQGGTVDIEKMTVEPWSTVILPDAARQGYTLDGWYSAPAAHGEGERFGGAGDSYAVEKSTAMHARWILPIDDGDSVIQGIVVVRVSVGAGTFTMGSPQNEPGRIFDETQREVTLTRDFWISKYPITNAQFGRAVSEGEEDNPVVNVDWFEASRYADSIGGSLPTEAQWEFAARGGNEGKDLRHIYSGSDNLDAVGWYEGNSGGRIHPVGRKLPNELGIYDMSGNVWEWVYDRYGTYDDAPVTDPSGPETGEDRVHRGGGWNAEARECRVADRAHSQPSVKSGYIGFRVVFPTE